MERANFGSIEYLFANMRFFSQQIVAPEEPLALRLSSNLLCGISRIYQQQVSQTNLN